VGSGTPYSVTVVFNGDGTPASFDGAATPPNLAISGWTSGANDSVVSLGMGTQNVADGVTQYSSSYSTAFVNQDGTKFGNFFGVKVDDDGIVTALFDNGQTQKIYKIPLATFPNPNGLDEKTGTAFTQSERSGDFFLRSAKEANAGSIAPSSLESSTADLATEFTKMIITQRAYSASTKIITTADEMLTDLLQVKR
jgi:flagellar hook protein FlgE